jgi:asparagine synthase (glutamine-hydrolysing)
MCGIAGIFRHDGGPIDRDLLIRMTAALAHRGPDGQGLHTEPGIGLGHRRLAIIDTQGGTQPMCNEDASVHVIFNGEIYNYPALRPELQALGHVFANRSDTEAIVHAWEEWGPACVERLDGMFAFALWDRRRGMLFLARDRLGKKPLHYAQTPSGLVFASELRALADLPGVPLRIDPVAVDDYLAYGYIPDPASIYVGIRKLPPAHTLLIGPPDRARRRCPTPQRYWHPARAAADDHDARSPQAHGGLDAAADELRRRLKAATAARLMADVPLGAFLSGGVDSSGVAAAAARARAEAGLPPLDTFTIGFAGGDDETPYATAVARHCGTRQHTESAAAIDWIAAARDQAAVFGEPFGDPSAVPTRIVCGLARRHATVALSGDGGDEVFAGYRRYRFHLLVERARRLLPPAARRGAVATLARLYPKLDRAPRLLRAKHTLTELSLESGLGYFRTMARIQDERRRDLYAPLQAAALGGHDPGARISALMAESGQDEPLAQAQYVDLQTWLPGMMLTKVDRTSMAEGLEVRCPFLDHRLVSWGLGLPPSLKLGGGGGKRVLKRALEAWVPRAVLYRPKQGFATSLAGPLRAAMPRLHQLLLGPGLLDAGLFNRDAVARLLAEHASGQCDHAQPLWSLLVLEGFLTGARPSLPVTLDMGTAA